MAGGGGSARRRRRRRLLSVLPYRLTRLGGPFNTLVGVHLRRPLLRRRLRAATAGLPDDLTVIIGHRNRADYRLRNAIRSIQAQVYQRGRISTLVVDYGSNPEQVAKLWVITDSLSAECIVVGGQPEWNRSHCLNIGLKRIRSRFVILTDVDIMFAPDFVAETVTALKRDPLTAVYSVMLHLPETTTAKLELAATSDTWLDLDELKPLGQIKTADPFSTGTVATYTHFFHEIRGYDEFYRAYGAEDSDVAQRLLHLGLRQVSVANRTYYLHQWHPRYEGVQSVTLNQTIQRNVEYFNRTRSLKRNPEGWGLGS